MKLSELKSNPFSLSIIIVPVTAIPTPIVFNLLRRSFRKILAIINTNAGVSAYSNATFGAVVRSNALKNKNWLSGIFNNPIRMKIQ